MSKLNSKGFGAIEILLVIIVIGALTAVGFYAWHANSTGPVKVETTNISSSVIGQESDSDNADMTNVLATLTTYCQQTYRQTVWATSGIDPSTITLVKTDKAPTIGGNFARMAIGCDSSQIPADKKTSGFVAYLKKDTDTWKFYSKAQATPDCSKFDNQKWPLQIVSSCDDNGTFRQPK